MKRCSGCGVILQTQDENQLGYVKTFDHTLCLDCFNLKHYAKVKNQDIHQGDMPQIEEEALVVYVLSTNHFNERFKFRLDRFYPNSNFILVLNHIDTLEKSVNLGKMIHQLKYEAAQLKMKFLDIVPVSALQDYNIDVLMSSMKYHQNKRNIYLVGFQNSGKSLIFKRISEKLNIDTTVLSGKKPGLTLHNFELAFNNLRLTDTPGIYHACFIANYLPYDDYKRILIETKVKPRNYQLDSNQSIYIGGFAAVSYLEGSRKGITFYANQNLGIHRTKYDPAYQKFIARKGDLFIPTCEATYTKHTFRVKDQKKYEINIAEVCFIHFTGQSVFEIYAPKGLHVSMMEALY